MIQRVTKKTHIGYKRYGGRGITVDPRWRKFDNFLADMGVCPSSIHSLDRIDTDGNYEAANCRWATPKEQARNRCNTIKLSFNGCEMSLDEWAEITGLNRQTIKDRVFKYQWPVEQALTTSPDVRSRRWRGLLPSTPSETL